MVKAAAERGWIDEREVVLENLAALHRAGAGGVIGCYAPDGARCLSEPGSPRG